MAAIEPGSMVRALYTYAGTGRESELVFDEGAMVRFISTHASGWGWGELNGTKGWFPTNFFEPAPHQEPERKSSTGSTAVAAAQQRLQQQQETHQQPEQSPRQQQLRHDGQNSESPRLPPRENPTDLRSQASRTSASTQHKKTGSVGALAQKIGPIVAGISPVLKASEEPLNLGGVDNAIANVRPYQKKTGPCAQRRLSADPNASAHIMARAGSLPQFGGVGPGSQQRNRGATEMIVSPRTGNATGARFHNDLSKLNPPPAAPELDEVARIYSISIAEFDIDEGNTLSVTYPLAVDFGPLNNKLADLCLPDGAHYHTEDWVYVFLWDYDVDHPALYGMAFFASVRDEKYKRGAVQRSVLLLSTQPYFHFYEELLRAATQQCLVEGNDQMATLHSLYTTLNDFFEKRHANPGSFHLIEWLKVKLPFTLPPKLSKFDTYFPSASLIGLIKQFKEKTMIFWYSLLLSQKLCFSSGGNSGIAAHDVANWVIAAPALIFPLDGFSHQIFPYVSITDISPIEKNNFYIIGSTNALFDERTEWWNALGTAGRKGPVVNNSGVKLNSADKEFMSEIMKGLKKGEGETWVRARFKKRTKAVLQRAINGNQNKHERETLANLKTSPLVVRWRQRKNEAILRKMNTLKGGGAAKMSKLV
eukprot:TRINITY_DN4428_c0_g5_i1.p1 TRINITY_DN4428_c0_g5~~TRINITY_DN4428_c0_g5_i1.p1  ORF type:complete len:648 (-),score=154.01 TRINITY_DN4428_c0_g5_i1:9-1952(-)